MEGHHGEVWALAVSNEGKFVVSGSHDRSIRVWEKTDEPVSLLFTFLSFPSPLLTLLTRSSPFSFYLQLFLEEEREKELDQLYDSNLADNLNRTAAHESADPSAQDKEVSTVTKQTLETLMSGEKVMEALDLADEERLAWREYERDQKKGLNTSEPEQNAVLKARGLNADENVKAVLEKIPNANLQDALIVLPFRYVQSMLECLSVWAKRVCLFPLYSLSYVCSARSDLSSFASSIAFGRNGTPRSSLESSSSSSELTTLRSSQRTSCDRRSSPFGPTSARRCVVNARPSATTSPPFGSSSARSRARRTPSSGRRRGWTRRRSERGSRRARRRGRGLLSRSA
jgi:hypothetical protein